MENYVARTDLYEYSRPDLMGRTEARLTRMREMGMEEMGVAEFGVRNIMSGLYIEKVWHMNDTQFDDYIKWAQELIAEKQPLVDAARHRAYEKLKGVEVPVPGDFGKMVDNTIAATLGSDGRYHIRLRERFNFWHFPVTKEEMEKIQKGEI